MFRRLAYLASFVLVLALAGRVSAELVLHLPFDEGSGDVTEDISASGLQATLERDVEWTAGMFGSAVTFTDGHVEVSGDPLNLPQITVMAWVNPTSIQPEVPANHWTNHNNIYGKKGNNGDDSIGLSLMGGDGVYFYVDTGADNYLNAEDAGVQTGQWQHIAATFDGTTMRVFLDGEQVGEMAAGGSDSIIEIHHPVRIGGNPDQGTLDFDGAIDDVKVFDLALTTGEIQQAMRGGAAGLASNPDPAGGAADVPRDVDLNWTPGEYANTHDVYFGTVFGDVNDAGANNPLDALVSQGQTTTTFDVGVLNFSETYYWRVDEVNAAPDNTIFQGDVWSFEVEPISVPITNISVTASSAHADDMIPENTINGSGLNELDQHSIVGADMWLSGMGDPEPTIQFAFDKAYKLHEMWVWNSNQNIESFIGMGAKDVVVETSLDATDWTVLEGATQLAQAPGTPGYTANNVLDFGGVLARYVKITIFSGHGISPQQGLSEVRFLYIPTWAREPEPLDGSATESATVALAWRAGREAASHQVLLGTNANDLALVDTTTEASTKLTALNYATTYFWQVKEVNDAEDPAAYAGPIWSFSTPAYGTVDDFDQYDDDCNRIFFAWLDGLGHNGGEDIDDCDIASYNGNGTGSIVGNATSPFAEKTVVHSGTQSMPLAYDSGASETTIALDAQDWTASGIQSLSLYFYGTPGNTGQLYVKINNSKVAYDGLPDALERQQWIPWNIDLAATGASLSNVTSLTLGIEGASGLGMIYVDAIRLYPLAPETIEPVLPDAGDPNLVAHYEFEGNANDAKGNYHGTPAGGPTYTAGKLGQGISLDEIDDQVVHVFAQEEVWSAYTVSLWAKTDLMAQNVNSSLFSVSVNTTSGFQIDLDGTDPGNYRYHGSVDSILGTATSSWVHIGASCDGIQTRLYYNGLLTQTINVADTNFSKLAVGVNRAADNWFGGVIDEVKVYDRALSSGEIAGIAGLTGLIHEPL